MQVVFYSDFPKRQNSTKRPTGQGVTLSGTLKEASSILRPVIRIPWTSGGAPVYTFAYIPDFGRYYHVRDKVYNPGFWEFTLIVDVLATYKEDILNEDHYILYSSSNYNTQIVDNRLSTISKPFFSRQTAAFTPSTQPSNGCYCVTVIGSGGGTQSYIMSFNDLGALIDAMSIEDGTEFTDQMEQLFAGASINAILNACWLPFDPETVGGASQLEPVMIGNWDSGVNARYALLYVDFLAGMSLSFGNAPDDFRRCAPYLKAEMWLPFVGKVAFPVDEFRQSTLVNIHMVVDPSTATIVYIIAGDNGGIMTISGSCGHQIPISTLSINTISALENAASTVGNAVGLNIGSAASDLFNTVLAMESPTMSTVGGISSKALNGAFRLLLTNLSTWEVAIDWYWCTTMADPSEVAAKIGRPCYDMHTLSSLSGFCQCANASSAAGELEEETNEINSFLNGGFYIE